LAEQESFRPTDAPQLAFYAIWPSLFRAIF
jgi:hypothetical protein